jgi:hydrogenase/urease accessory protein HupE
MTRHKRLYRDNPKSGKLIKALLPNWSESLWFLFYVSINSKIKKLLKSSIATMILCLVAPTTFAHNLNFGSLTLQKETAQPDTISLVFQMSDDQGRHLRARIGIPVGCDEQFHTVELFSITRMRYRQDLHCPGKKLSDLIFPLIAILPSARVMVYVKQDGETIDEQMLAPEQSAWQASENPVTRSSASVLQKFLSLGFVHILLGWDHVLFVWMLVLLVTTTRHLIWTITAFTIGHSLTLGMAASALLTVPIPPTEALIALSILFLAAEILRFDHSGHKTITLRYPGLISISFGLFHGLGFSAVLREFQSDESPILWQLAGFNVGVELGQLLFVIALLTTGSLIKKLLALKETWIKDLNTDSQMQRITRTFRQIVATLCGAVASFALIERVMGF